MSFLKRSQRIDHSPLQAASSRNLAETQKVESRSRNLTLAEVGLLIFIALGAGAVVYQLHEIMTLACQRVLGLAVLEAGGAVSLIPVFILIVVIAGCLLYVFKPWRRFHGVDADLMPGSVAERHALVYSDQQLTRSRRQKIGLYILVAVTLLLAALVAYTFIQARTPAKGVQTANCLATPHQKRPTPTNRKPTQKPTPKLTATKPKVNGVAPSVPTTIVPTAPVSLPSNNTLKIVTTVSNPKPFDAVATSGFGQDIEVTGTATSLPSDDHIVVVDDTHNDNEIGSCAASQNPCSVNVVSQPEGTIDYTSLVMNGNNQIVSSTPQTVVWEPLPKITFISLPAYPGTMTLTLSEPYLPPGDWLSLMGGFNAYTLLYACAPNTVTCNISMPEPDDGENDFQAIVNTASPSTSGYCSWVEFTGETACGNEIAGTTPDVGVTYGETLSPPTLSVSSTDPNAGSTIAFTIGNLTPSTNYGTAASLGSVINNETGAIVGACSPLANTTSCTVLVSSTLADLITYTAQSNIASSVPITVDWKQPTNPSTVVSTANGVTLTFSTSASNPASGSPVALTATATPALGASQYIYIENTTDGNSEQCGLGISTCTLSDIDNEAQIEQASVYEGNGNIGADTQLIFDNLDVTWPTPSDPLTLSASTTDPAPGQLVTFTTTGASLPAGWYLYTPSTGQETCTGFPCTTTDLFTLAGTQTYIAFLYDEYNNLISASNPVTIDWPGTSLDLSLSTHFTTPGSPVTFTISDVPVSANDDTVEVANAGTCDVPAGDSECEFAIDAPATTTTYSAVEYNFAASSNSVTLTVAAAPAPGAMTLSISPATATLGTSVIATITGTVGDNSVSLQDEQTGQIWYCPINSAGQCQISVTSASGEAAETDTYQVESSVYGSTGGATATVAWTS